MKATLLIKVLILNLLLLSSCYATKPTSTTQPSSASKFTSDNAMKLRLGMTSAEIIELFGKPMKTSALTCGSATDKPWSCIIWYYGEYRPSFTFSQGEDGVLYLNNWTM